MTTYEAEQKLRKYDDVEDRHWNECGQIALYDDELRKAKELLKEAEHLLRTAMWVNYRQEDAAAVLREKIDRLLGGDGDDD